MCENRLSKCLVNRTAVSTDVPSALASSYFPEWIRGHMTPDKDRTLIDFLSDHCPSHHSEAQAPGHDRMLSEQEGRLRRHISIRHWVTLMRPHIKGFRTATSRVPCRDHTSFLFGTCGLHDASSPYPASNTFLSAVLALQACLGV